MMTPNAFLSALHRVHLRPGGYRKSGHTFSRDRGDFTERIQIQGSSWNDSSGPWRFYLNFGVTFHGAPRRLPDRDFPQTHCWARISRIVPDAPPFHELCDDAVARAVEVADIVRRASERAM